MVFKFPDEVIDITKKLQSGGFEVYVVGGAVRDLLQNEEVHDWDFATDATPAEIQKVFPGSFYENDFGTVGLPVEKEIYEVTTFRTEFGYADRRRPDKVEWGKSFWISSGLALVVMSQSFGFICNARLRTHPPTK